MHTEPDRRQALLGFCLLSLTAIVAGGAVGPRVVYSTFTSYAESSVPGVSGAKFVWFDRPICDPNGNTIVFTADANGDPNGSEVLILRTTNLSGTGALIAREGNDIGTTGFKNGTMRARILPRWDGSFVYSTSSDANDVGDEMLVRYTDPNYAIVAREGDSVPGFGDPNEKLGTWLHSPNYLADGNLAFVTPGTWKFLSDPNDDRFVIRGGDVFLQSNNHDPTGEQPSGPRKWEQFDPDRLLSTPDGAHYLLAGELQGDAETDDVLVYDSNVVLQEGYAFPAGDPNDVVGWIVEIELSPSGDWMAHGRYLDPNRGEFIARNGSLIARTNDAVPCGLNGDEYFRDAFQNETFFLMASNEHGDFVYGGHTFPEKSEDPNDQAAVLIFHDSTTAVNDFPVLRTGMRVDMNADDQLDANDPQIIAFKEHSACLTPGNVLFVVVLLELPSEAVGEALIRFRICFGDADHDGDVDWDDWDLIAFNQDTYPPCGTSGDVTADGYVDNNDLSLCEFSMDCSQGP